jgi:hypothetical protein
VFTEIVKEIYNDTLWEKIELLIFTACGNLVITGLRLMRANAILGKTDCCHNYEQLQALKFTYFITQYHNTCHQMRLKFSNWYTHLLTGTLQS